MPHERRQHVEAVQPVAGVDRQVERDERQLVGARHAERPVDSRHEVAQLRELDELRRVRVVTLPHHVEHLQIVLRHAHLLLLVRLVEVLEDHGDVHVDDDEERDEDERHHEEDGHHRAAAVAVGRRQPRAVRMRPELRVALVARRHQRVEHVVPAGGRREAEQQHQTVGERLEVHDVVEHAREAHAAERRHAEDGVDEDDQRQQHADVEQRRQRDDEREEQLADALRRADEAQHAPDPEDADDAQQRRLDDETLEDVRQHDACAADTGWVMGRTGAVGRQDRRVTGRTGLRRTGQVGDGQDRWVRDRTCG